MTELLKVKVRRIGTSLGVLLPQKNLYEKHVQEGDEVELALLTHPKDFSGFGLARKAIIPFVRDKKARHFA